MTWSDWHQMTSHGITFVPEKSGVYQLNAGTETLYHGQSTNLKRRFGEHLNSNDSCIQKTTQFVYQTTDDPEGLEELLLKNYMEKYGKLPPCNELSN